MKHVIRLLLLYALAGVARPFARRSGTQAARILYIKPDHLGDLLLATPVLAALRASFPKAHVTALVGPWSQLVLRRNPDIDRVLTCPFPGFTRQPKIEDRGRLVSILRPYWELLRYALLLRRDRYDLAIIGRDDHWWGAALALLAGIPARVGFAVPECRPFLTNALPWDPHEHVTAQGLALVAAAEPRTTQRVPDREPRIEDRGWRMEDGISLWRNKHLLSFQSLRLCVKHGRLRVRWGFQKNKTLRTENSEMSPGHPVTLSPAQFPARFDPAPEEHAWAAGWLREHGVVGDAPLVVIHPGTGGPAKLWRAERWAQVVDAVQAIGAGVVITGGPGEQELVEEVAGRAATRPLALAGRTTVGQLAALLCRAALVLGVDSGPLHLAAAQGLRTLHLYGPGDAGRFGPWGDPERHTVIHAALWCSPCGVFDACPRGLAQPECMERITVAQVIERAREMLTRK